MRPDPFQNVENRLQAGSTAAVQEPADDAVCADIIFELCAEDLNACRAAAPGGAHRVELCTALEVGGLTPPDALIAAAVEESSLPVHVLLRPTAETFEYSAAMFRQIADSMECAKRLGAAGFVLGMLRAGKIDRAATCALVEAAEGLPVTFHRAFDQVEDRQVGLQDLIEAGCTRVLTSAGARDVVAGAKGLALLQAQAAGRIAVAAGGGLRLRNANKVARISGVQHFHGSLRDPETMPGQDALPLEQRIAHMIAALRHGAALRDQDRLHRLAEGGTA